LKKLDNPFKKAGLILLIVGILDIAIMIYCIINQIPYASSFNIFALIAGILLIKSSVKTARIIRWLSIFLVITLIGIFLISTILTPFDLFVTQIKLNPIDVLSSYAFSFFLLTALVWVYFLLSTPQSLEKLNQAGYKIGKPMSALYSAIASIIFFGTLTGWLLHGEAADKAIAMAQNQLGLSYKYYVSSLSITGNNGTAVVTAYTNNEVKNIHVQW